MLARNSGRARSVAEVLAAAQADPLPRPSLADGSLWTDALSARERKVLALVAAGRTNKAIAALFVSPNTVKTHVISLLHKLEADSRAHLAAIATVQGLHPLTTPASR